MTPEPSMSHIPPTPPIRFALIGAAGRYEAMKDFRNLLTAAASVHRTHANARFVLAGSGVDESNGELVSMSRELGVDGIVHLLGYRRDMPRVMASLDLFCSSSAYGEGMQNTLGEAMAAAVPCVATDVGDAAVLVGETGRIVPPRDSEALATAMRELLASPSRLMELGRRARERITAAFSIGASVARYENLYAGLSSRRADE